MALSVHSAGALEGAVNEVPIQAEALDMETLLYHATRYGNTPLRKDNKARARHEVRKRLPGSFSDIMNRLHADNIGLQVFAMELVRETGPRELVAEMTPYIFSENQDIAKVAVFFLSFKDAGHLAGRVRPLLSDETLRGVSMRALAAWNDKESAPAISAFLTSTNERIRIASANALRDLADPAQIPALVKALDDPVFTVRNAAARAVVTFLHQAVPYLEQALSEAGDVRLRRQLFRCLGVIGTAEASAAYHRAAQGESSPWVIMESRFFLESPLEPLPFPFEMEPPLF
jgi:hypothetical protein